MLTRQTKLSQLVFVVIFLLLPAWRWGAALALVQLGDDGLDDVLHLLLLGLELLSVGLLHITQSQSAVHLEAQDVQLTGLSSSHLIFSLMTSSILLCSSSLSFPPNFSLSPIWFFRLKIIKFNGIFGTHGIIESF